MLLFFSFVVGREKAIQRKIAEDIKRAKRRNSELDSAFMAAAAIGKMSVSREKRIMEKITRGNLMEEEMAFEAEKQDILSKAEKEIRELELEHEKAEEHIQDLAIDVLTPDERVLFEK